MDLFAIPSIEFEGSDAKNPLAFRYYDPQASFRNTSMQAYLRFSIAYWHTLVAGGADPFGLPTAVRPWDYEHSPMKKAELRVHAMFEFAEKLKVPFFCFHDRDIAPEGETLSETNKNLDAIVDVIVSRMADSPVRVLWGTANLFSNPLYMHGAATSPFSHVFAHAAAQVKKAMEVTHRLGGANYVFWGGREGYETLLNTDMQHERDTLASFLQKAVDYAKALGFTGQLLIEPKPKEPTKHQYDFDVASAMEFLRAYGLSDYFKFNIETNHATLAGHTLQHELEFARSLKKLGSIDANQGDLLLGWDTDQFPTDLYTITHACMSIIKNDGIAPGGLNFDAKLRRPSYTPDDLFYGHIAGIDNFARGMLIAQAIIDDGYMDAVIEERYASYKEGIGKQILDGSAGFVELETYAHENATQEVPSGRQELLEHYINRFL